mmetsp:Transcript_55176/g.119184  ORF Transcript_55176/g.119184 Transcript_55176/m.119184 type:complete len:203 (-) Transcript_55176:1562-2170(-)
MALSMCGRCLSCTMRDRWSRTSMKRRCFSMRTTTTGSLAAGPASAISSASAWLGQRLIARWRRLGFEGLLWNVTTRRSTSTSLVACRSKHWRTFGCPGNSSATSARAARRCCNERSKGWLIIPCRATTSCERQNDSCSGHAGSTTRQRSGGTSFFSSTFGNTHTRMLSSTSESLRISWCSSCWAPSCSPSTLIIWWFSLWKI